MRFYEQIDASRHWQARFLDLLGWGPVETPFRTVHSGPGVTLKGYGNPRDGGPIVVLVPAPIKRAYIWDLAPGASVVEHCLDGGLRVYLVQWEAPEEGAPGPGLADYADRLLLDCLNAVAGEAGDRGIFLAGHSLGGTLCAMFSALHPDRVRGLVTIASPFHFDFHEKSGALGPLIGAASRIGLLEAGAGPLPGSFLSTLSFAASPGTFGRERMMDWLTSLPDEEALRTHLRVERWTLDELPLSRRFVAEVVEHLYRRDGFMRGNLVLNGMPVAPRQVVSPLMTVGDRRCLVVPPAAFLPFHDAAGSRDKQLVWYQGDAGVALQHVGMLVGRNAHRTLWPEILRWVGVRDRVS